MYNESNVIDIFLKEYPGFKKDWEEHLEYWGTDERSIGIDIFGFFEYVIKIWKNDEDVEPKKLFALVEDILTQGSESVQYAISMHFLSGLVHQHDHGCINL